MPLLNKACHALYPRLSRPASAAPLQQQLAAIIAEIHDKVGRASDFVISQLPDVAQQAILYGRVTATTAIVIAVIAMIICVLSMRWACFVFPKNRDKYHGDERQILAVFVSIVFGFVGFAVFLANINNFIMIWFAPKVWLIKELASLIK